MKLVEKISERVTEKLRGFDALLEQVSQEI